MGLGALGDGGVACCARLQGDAELSDERMDPQGIGGDDARIGGQRGRGFYGLETWVDDVCRAPGMGAEAGLAGGAACALCGIVYLDLAGNSCSPESR